MEHVIPILLFIMSLAAIATTKAEAPTASFLGDAQQNATSLADSAQSKLETAPRCDVAGNKEITISCDYTAAPVPVTSGGDTPRIVLNHAAFSFMTNNENKMRIELTFTNDGTSRTPGGRSVYLTIDNDSGDNYVRRVLPHVDFSNLAPGQQMTFSERLLIPAFQHGRYTINLWIPDTDPAFQFNPAHNLLIDSVGVPDRKNGLNKVANFTVVR